MLKLTKDSIKVEWILSGGVCAVLKTNSLAVVTRRMTKDGTPAYSVYSGEGEVLDGKVHELVSQEQS